MSDDNQILTNIRWDIRETVTNATWRVAGEDPCKKTKIKLTDEELDAVVFSDVVTIRFYIDDAWTSDLCVDRQITAPVTVRSLLTFIRDFYRKPMDEKTRQLVFAENEDFLEEVMDRTDGNPTLVDGFDDEFGLPFEGLEHHGDNVYEVMIGPI